MPFLKRRRFVSVIGRKSAVPDGLWLKCPGCKQTVYRTEVEGNLHVCPRCGHHYRINAITRIELMVDPDSFEETHADIATTDPLGFTVGDVHYLDKVERAKEQTGLHEAIVTGVAQIEQQPVVIGVMDFAFRGGSMGSIVGEKFVRAANDAIEHRIPLLTFAASGGARMEEGILSLMQMAKTAGAVHQLNEARIPYISVLTDPTTGGVFASFASVADFVFAEPNAHIGFAGPRLIKGALKVDVPKGFQTSEFQFENGFIDGLVPRTELRSFLGRLLQYVKPQ